jgi:heterodisulfide reductase subunit C
LSGKVDGREVDFISLMLKRAVGEMNAEVCEQCGKCSSACPVSRQIEGFNPRRLIERVAIGRTEGLLRSEEIWKCSTCLKCVERCPEDISPYDVILVLRNLAYRAGYEYPPAYDDFIGAVSEKGLAQRPQRVRTRAGEQVDRESLGLPPVDGPKNMERFNEIMRGILGAGRPS